MNRVNPHFRSKYADLSAVRDAIVPVFTKHGLSIVQAPSIKWDGMFVLETTIFHESGESLSWDYPLPQDFSKPQALGSAISYARRYTLSAIAAIASEEDDDGNEAQNSNGGGRTSSNGPSAGPGPANSPAGPKGGIVL